jgi:hypothetical protein
LISPNEVDFGNIGVNCSSANRTITIYNVGTASTAIAQIELAASTGPAFTLSSLPVGIPSPPGPGVVIAPSQAITFQVGYHASALSHDAGLVQVFEQGRIDPYVIPLVGSGTTAARNTDRFTQIQTPKADILFVIDDSGSMAMRQQNLANNFGSFMQFANSQGLDYHLAVVSTDVIEDSVLPADPCPDVQQRPAGLLEGQCGFFADGSAADSLDPMMDPSWRIITRNTLPSPEAALRAIVDQGSHGAGFERGLDAAYKALSGSKISFGWNAGFLRPDAYLAIVIVSDDDDSRTDSATDHEVTDPNAPPVSFYVDFFRSIKGVQNTNQFSLSAIVEPSWTGSASSGPSCPDGSGEWPGFRYMDAANQTGGAIESICTSDWSRTLQNLGLSVFGYKARFFLSNAAVPASIVVQVDGVVVPAMTSTGQLQWSYDASMHSVKFEPTAIPEPGSQIEVTYTAACM